MTFLIAAMLGGCFGEYVPNPYADSDDWPITTETGKAPTGTESGDSGDTADTADTGDTATAGPPAPHPSWLRRFLAWAGI